MLERRAHSRQKMILPVKISLADDAQMLGYTIDVTQRGAKMAGFHQVLEVGATIKVIRGFHSASFRVVWVQNRDGKQLQIGVEAVDANDNFWGVNLKQDSQRAKGMDAVLELLKTPRDGKEPSLR